VNRPEEQLEIESTAAGWQVTVALPGIAPDDLKIEVSETALDIQTSNTDGSEASGFRYHLDLPSDVVVEAVRKELADGVLTVTLPRGTPAPPSTPASTPIPESLLAPEPLESPGLPKPPAADLPPQNPA